MGQLMKFIRGSERWRFLSWPAICYAVFCFASNTGWTQVVNPESERVPTDLEVRAGTEGLGVIALGEQQVVQLADLAIGSIDREFPNKPSNVMGGAEDVLSPKQMHPVFYGCFDWHSSVHGHWLLVRLLKLYPENARADTIRKLMNRQLTKSKLQTEADYFLPKRNHSFERMYGWAWTLRLVTELRDWQDPDAQTWLEHLAPLESTIVKLTKAYLPRLTYPIRTGEHPDTGFALAQMLDYARVTGDEELETQIVQFARDKYLEDYDYPARYEPSGQDFFSTCLNEADLMRRVLSASEFSDWLSRFLPELGQRDGTANSLLTPAVVSDASDGKLVHLAGLNFSRSWTQAGIAQSLSKNDARRNVLVRSIAEHRNAGMQYVFSGHYEGEHWLATFAVYVLTGTGLPNATTSHR